MDDDDDGLVVLLCRRAFVTLAISAVVGIERNLGFLPREEEVERDEKLYAGMSLLLLVLSDIWGE